MSLTKIGSIGINTGIAFAGVTTIVTLNTANDALSIGATVNVGSGITLGASGDIFATGVSTFSGNLKVGSGVTLSPDGDVFFTGIATGNGSGLTALNATQLTSGTVPTARLGSGTASSSTFLRGDSTFQTVDTNLVADTSPQLGGDLDTNSHNILLDDDHYVKFGDSSDLTIRHTGGANAIDAAASQYLYINSDNLRLNTKTGSEKYITGTVNGAVELYYDNSNVLQTISGGADINGVFRPRTNNASTLGNVSYRWNDIFTNNIDIADSGKLKFGTSDDFQLSHDGSTNIIDGQFHPIEIRHQSEVHIKCVDDGAVELYHNNTKRVETTAYGTKFPNGRIELPDESGHQFQLGAIGDFTMEHDGSNTYLKNITGNTVLQNDAAVEITASSGGTKRFRFDSDGLKFGTDTAAANALDDYEEGTWTPSIQQGGGSISTLHAARYTKIGRLVHINCYISYSTANDSAAFQMGGLPFACLSQNYETGVTDFGKGGKKGAYCRTHSGNSYMEFLYSSESTTSDRLTLRGNNIGTGYIILSNTYMTA